MDFDLRVLSGTFPAKAQALILPIFKNQVSQNKLVKIIEQKSKFRLLDRLKKDEFVGDENQLIVFENTPFYEVVVLVGLGGKNELNLAKLKNALAEGFRAASNKKIKSADLFVDLDWGKDLFELGKNIGMAFYLSNYRFLKYKSEKEKKKLQPIDLLNIYTTDSNKKTLENGTELASHIAKGVYLVRDLVNEPASHLGVGSLEQVAFSIEKKSKGRVKVEVLDKSECQKLGMGAFLGVSQGSDREPKFIILKSEEKANNKKYCIVGKTIIFDSGGLSLKTSESMEDMKMDMAGGATVLGLFEILARLPDAQFKQVVKNKNIYGILPACENMPSGKALRPGDIVKALNGKTIEVLNTDAEGRLTLADGLSYAEKHLKADYIVDLATLTGSCMVALGTDLAGLFGNDQRFRESFEKQAEYEADELWTLPLNKTYSKMIKSDIADLKNITSGKYGGAITAALFLEEFVSKAKWIHIDIAGPAFRHDEPRGIWPKGATGWGVTTLVEFLRKL